jgi:hypothetical protein
MMRGSRALVSLPNNGFVKAATGLKKFGRFKELNTSQRSSNPLFLAESELLEDGRVKVFNAGAKQEIAAGGSERAQRRQRED